MKKITLKVNGMVCNGCENRVKKALENIEGTQCVSANHESGIVTITSKEEIEESKFIEIIENLGFEIKKED